jgi:hypothetical protein
MLYAAVFLFSFATLALEILLARGFSICQWNHLSFMVVSIALFGFAASGSLLSAMPGLRAWAGGRAIERAVAGCAVLFSVSSLTALTALNRLPLDYYRLALEPVQAAYLLAAYILLSLPFFIAGAGISLAYIALPERSGRIYCASMAGSALGAVMPAPLLPLLPESAVMVLAALAPLVLLIAARTQLKAEAPAAGRRSAVDGMILISGALAGTLGLWLLTPAAAAWREFHLSEYKSLAQVRKFPQYHTLAVETGIRGRLERVQSPHLRFAPGLSLKYAGRLPAADAIYTDGDRPFYLYHLPGEEAARFARSTLSFVPYALQGRPRNVLLIALGGGLSIPCALSAGAEEVRILQPDPRLAHMIAAHYGRRVDPGNPRSFLAATPERFDIIHLESWGASIPGAGALDQDHTLSLEAMADYLQHLTESGLVVISRHLLLPPADMLRLWATARQALARISVPDPSACIAILRNWNTYTLLAGRRPIADPGPIRDIAARGNFDLVYLKGLAEADANRFNVFEAPYHYREIRRLEDALRNGREEAFYRSYLLDVRPRTDSSPFPGRFLKWSRVRDLYRTLGGRLHALFLSGELVVAAVFCEALVLTLALLVLPAGAAARREGRIPFGAAIYFGGIGAGFMFTELFCVHVGTFLLGEPVISLALVLTAVLAASGLGGLLAQRLGAGALRWAPAAAAGAAAAAAGVLALFAPALLPLGEIQRQAALFLLSAAAGLALGVPFPLGMRRFAQRPADRAFAWAVNGCASVLAAIASAGMAIAQGFEWLLASAVLGYVTALLAAILPQRARPRGRTGR